MSNSQCGVVGTGSMASGNGGVLTLTLQLTFSSAYSGNKIIYMAARTKTATSGWQPLGVWNIPGSPVTGPWITGVSPARLIEATGAAFTFYITDPSGYTDLGVVDILVNDFLDGNQACYVAYDRNQNLFYLLNDSGTALLPPLVPGSIASVENSQCSIIGASSLANGSGNQLTLNLYVQWKSGFSGNRVVYAAARSTGDVLNSGWQAVGTATIP